MNGRNAIIALIVILLLVGGYFLFTSRDGGDFARDGDGDVAGTSTGTSTDREGAVRGTIISIDRSQVPADGPTLITLRTDDGRQVVVAVPSMGLPQCAARDNIEDVSTLRVNMDLEVNGEPDSEGRIVPCESDEHYLLVASK